MWIKASDGRLIHAQNGVIETVLDKQLEDCMVLQFVPFGGKPIVLQRGLDNAQLREYLGRIEEALAEGKMMVSIYRC